MTGTSGYRNAMATRQRLTGTTSRGRRYSEERQRHQQREELWTEHRRHQRDHEQGGHDGSEDSSGADLVPWSAIAPPFFCLPLDSNTSGELVLPFGLYGTFDEDEAVNPNRRFGLHDEYFLYEIDFDELRQHWGQHAAFLDPSGRLQEHAHILQSSVLHAFHTDDRQEALSLTGEPYVGAYMNDEQPHMMSWSFGGSGDTRGELETIYQDPWQAMPCSYYGPVVSSCATVSVFLKHGVRIDISLERAVRVVNYAMLCSAAIGRLGGSCVCHPWGRVLQEGTDVHMATGARLAKISSRGVTFTAFNHGLVYLVDASGTKSTTERFRNLSYDLALSLFSTNPEPDADSYNKCFQIVAQARYRTMQNGDAMWTVAGVRIKQTMLGDVQVSRRSGRRAIWTSPAAGTISLATPLLNVALSCNARRYFFVKTGTKRLSGNAEGFVVRNGSQSAGFDRRGRLTLP